MFSLDIVYFDEFLFLCDLACLICKSIDVLELREHNRILKSQIHN